MIFEVYCNRYSVRIFFLVKLRLNPFKYNMKPVKCTSFTCVKTFWRTRHNTIGTFVIQWDVNKWPGILKFSPYLKEAQKTRFWHNNWSSLKKWNKLQAYLFDTCCLSGRPALSRSCRLTKAVHKTSLLRHTDWKLSCSVMQDKPETKSQSQLMFIRSFWRLVKS